MSDLTYKVLNTDGTITVYDKAAEIDSQLADVKNYIDTPVATYTHSGNKSAVISAIDLDTNTFTSSAHGFVNNNRISICLNNDNADIAFAYTYLPNGLTYGQLYVVNKTDDTFQLSLTAGGAAVDLITKATMDLTKWHVELTMVSVVIDNLPASKKYKVIIKGGNSRVGTFVLPTPIDGYANNFMETGQTAINKPANIPLGNLWTFMQVILDYNGYLKVGVEGFTLSASGDTSNAMTYVAKYYMSTVNKDTDITSIRLQEIYISNGVTVEVYKV